MDTIRQVCLKKFQSQVLVASGYRKPDWIQVKSQWHPAFEAKKNSSEVSVAFEAINAKNFKIKSK